MTKQELIAASQRMFDLRRKMRPAFKSAEQINEFIDAMITDLQACRVAVATVAPEPEAKPEPRKRNGTDHDRMERGGEDRSE